MSRCVSRAWQAMRAITAALILLLACAASTAVAGPLEDGQAAFKREDYVAALKAWKPLADQGNADAEFHLGEMYANGHGVLLNHGRALKWYRKAAAQGNADAQDALGFMYKSGLGVPRDFVEAIKWLRLAADKGNASAQFNLGMLYASGDGVTKDPAEAAKWYRTVSYTHLTLPTNREV